jgi:hypothetical protein
MRRKTIARNPLDELAAPKRKGRKPPPPEVRSDIRAALQSKPAPAAAKRAAPRRPDKDAGVSGWLKSVWSSLTD